MKVEIRELDTSDKMLVLTWKTRVMHIRLTTYEMWDVERELAKYLKGERIIKE